MQRADLFWTVYDNGEAIAREKLLKRWKRDWKLDLIKTDNPDMLDLAADWFNQEQLDAIIAEYKNRRQEP